ncbi:MAG TPA: hypothetical protein PKA27_12245 [Fimbriimonadaceae bacterium]|nr:hypothetical protein [Fimbriimonadaceae bacterium]
MRYDNAADLDAMNDLFVLLSNPEWEVKAWHEKVAARAWTTPLEPLDPRVFAQDVPGGHRFYDVSWPKDVKFGGVTWQHASDMLIHEAANYRVVSLESVPLYIFAAGDAVAMSMYGRLEPENPAFYGPPNPPSTYSEPDGPEFLVVPIEEDLLPPLSRTSLDYVLRMGCGIAEPKVVCLQPNVPDALPDLAFNIFLNRLKGQRDIQFVWEALSSSLPRHLRLRVHIIPEGIVAEDQWEPLKSGDEEL